MVRRGQQEGGAQGSGGQAAEAAGSSWQGTGTGDTAEQQPAKKKRGGDLRKKGKKKESRDGLITEVLPLMAKLVLQNTQQLRDVASATLTTWFLKKD